MGLTPRTWHLRNAEHLEQCLRSNPMGTRAEICWLALRARGFSVILNPGRDEENVNLIMSGFLTSTSNIQVLVLISQVLSGNNFALEIHPHPQPRESSFKMYFCSL